MQHFTGEKIECLQGIPHGSVDHAVGHFYLGGCHVERVQQPGCQWVGHVHSMQPAAIAGYDGDLRIEIDRHVGGIAGQSDLAQENGHVEPGHIHDCQTG